MRRWVIGWLTCSLWLTGCGGGLSQAASDYLKAASPYQQRLQQFQVDLKAVPQLPPTQRGPRAKAILAEVQSQRKAFLALQPPESVARVHSETGELYRIMEEFVQVNTGLKADNGNDTRLRKLGGEWSMHLQALQDELTRLESVKN